MSCLRPASLTIFLPVIGSLCNRLRPGDVCAVLDTLAPRLSTLVRRGVGLNSRVGAARFISSLAMRLASDMRRQSGSLISVSHSHLASRSQQLPASSSRTAWGVPVNAETSS